MEHLSTEILSRLLDEAPDPYEREHLQACASCATELQALRDQCDALRTLPDLRPPTGDWEALESRLVKEGLIRAERGRGTGTSRVLSRRWVQAAAAAALFLGGTGVGMGLAGAAPGGSRGADPAGRDPARTRTSLVAQAADEVRLAERRYLEALVRYRQAAEAQGGAEPGDPAVRFAALDALVAASRAAVREAPADPFINGILVSTLAERQAALRTISTSNDDNWF